MNYEDKVQLTKDNIRKAINDYWKHTERGTSLRDNISETFINRLARESVQAKENLRNMLRKHPAWNEELDALVISASTTHNPDNNKIWNLSRQIFVDKLDNYDADSREDLCNALRYFSTPEGERDQYLEALQKIAPDAYAPGKKISRVYKGLCDAQGVTDNTANSDFQRLFAQIADEMNSRQINYKLFVSINPAHFITMSNPKGDDRGSCLTSCHSFNSTEYEYNNGCTGYARDSVTMIVFTASNPGNPETLNNRKTTRQLFMYEPGNGLLLQSRMYNTSGGTFGAQAESKEYRDLIQRAISYCENAPVNNWKTIRYCGNDYFTIRAHRNFGGYADWEYGDFNAKISVRKDHKDDAHAFTIGEAGLCIACGRPTSHGIYCYDCDDNNYDYDDDYDDD